MSATAPPELLGALMHALADGLYVVAPDGAVDLVNDAGLAILGYDRAEELVGRPSHATIHAVHVDGSPFAEADCPLLLPRLTGEAVRVEDDWFVRRDGSMVPVAYSSAPFDREDGRAAVVVFRDTTALRQAVRAQELEASRRRLVEAADAERRRMGRDLHDGAQQRLLGVLLALQLAAADLPDDAPGRGHLDVALEEARAAVEDLRDLSAGLHPAVLTNRGLRAALVALTARAPLPVALDVPEDRLAPGVEAAAYFVAAEALANVVKHADAGEARVVVTPGGDRVEVRVEDDGRGGARPGAGSGLLGLADRVGALGGTFSAGDRPAGGTVVRAVLPLGG